MSDDDDTDHWKSIGEITRRILFKNAPVTYEVPLQPDLAVAVNEFAIKQNVKVETVIAEATRAYLGR